MAMFLKTLRYIPQFRKFHAQGFTLVEVLVVLIIMGVVAGFAMPQMMGSIETVRAGEAEQVLIALLGAQKRFEYRNGGYTGNLNNLDVAITTPDSFYDPTVANDPTSLASIKRNNDCYDLLINEDGVISCAEDSCAAGYCSKIGY